MTHRWRSRPSLRDLFLRVRALIAPNRVERELDEELAFHVARETEKHIAAGLSPIAARTRAIARFGPVPLAADQCRDARGTAVVDNLTRDIVYAFRTFRRAPLAALTIVATVALGLGVVAVVFTVYTLFFLRVDAVRSPDELFAVELMRSTDSGEEEQVPLARPEYDALRRETSVFADMAAMLDGGPPHVEGQLARSFLVTGNFFHVLGVQAALGRPLLPEDDQRSGGEPVVVLSHAGWHKLFQGERSVIGRRVMIGRAPLEIVGVMPDGFRGLSVTPPDYWAPLALAAQFRDAREEAIPLEVIGRLKPGVAPEAAAAAVSAWATGRGDLPPSRAGRTSASPAEALGGGGQTSTRRPLRASLAARQGTLSSDGFGVVFAPLFFAFGLILLIGCANVANLLLARGLSRQREIGIRLSLGASRGRIIRQLLTESLLLSLAAAICGVVVARLFLDGALYAVIATLPPEIAQFMSLFNLTAPTADWRVLVFLVGGAIAATVFFGLAPALHATRVDLVPAMHGELTRGARPRRARHALIAMQVGASVLLLVCAGIFLRGAITAATKNPDVRSDVLRISLETESRRGALLQALRSDPLVEAIAASSPATRDVASPSVTAPAAGASSLSVYREAVSSEYFDVLGIDVVSGRGFTPAERTADAGVVIVSESLAHQLWPSGAGAGVGQQIRVADPQPSSPSSAEVRSAKQESSRTFTVVGVVRDPGSASGSSLEAFHRVYEPTSVENPMPWLVRLRGNAEQMRPTMLRRLTEIDQSVMNVISLQALARLETYPLQIGFWVSVVLGGLALALTVSGVFSVLSYVVEQQAKEIGVRMALGAATKNVVRLIIMQSVRPVGIGLAAGGGLAAAVAIVLMSTPIAAELGDSIDVLDPGAYAASLLVIVVSCVLAVSLPALRAARIDPIATLRRD
jgi:predicted permease